METVLRSAATEVKIKTDGPFVIIGEKINPTGRKKLAEAFQQRNFDYVRELARKQVEFGADILDVNVGVTGIDDAALIPEVNGAAVIGLTMDENGISNEPESRLEIAARIIERASKLGIPIEDVVIDPLVMTVSVDQNAGMVTLKTIEMVSREFGVNINLGASSVSFGLPDRHTINQSFLALAISAGAICAITDSIKLGATIRSIDLLRGRDLYAKRYIQYSRAHPAEPKAV